ncbi:hypothetical protein GPECTOR_6g508 [Gonium pectorale]|uniref:Galactose oxidase n=1 Tax=Gonium pectorale TaxID=33097 RepID=A0A150GUT2_GONPE|nr:hypothetical protein GPECTOR_6g508 [Gonium pectorale]|eukprot:KXZ53591.1 hypothetical protein GPECTOR_6g508 [Gonium pectorale]
MRLQLVVLALLAGVGLAQELRWESPWSSGRYDAPEPRSYASLADLSGPLEHASMVALGGALVLVGGRHSNGTLNDGLFLLDPAANATWGRLSSKPPGAGGRTGPDSMPTLYWHAALPYSVGGSPRVLLCGGLAANGSASNGVYELSYNEATALYSYSTLAPLLEPVFGHSLAAAGDGAALLSGGLTGNLAELPRAPVFPGLRAALEGAIIGPAGALMAQLSAFRFDRNAGGAGAGGGGADGGGVRGAWSQLGDAVAVPRAVAFHASWVAGGVLHLYGGVQGSGVLPPADGSAPFLLQALQLPPAASAAPLAYNASATLEALGQWGAVQPGAVSGPAVWRDGAAANGSQVGASMGGMARAAADAWGARGLYVTGGSE